MSPTAINRLKLLGIGAVAIAPVLGSFLLYLFWSPSSYTNYGDLLTPRPVRASSLQLADGTPFELERLKGRWVLVTFNRGICGPECEKKLWIMRQVRQAQGKELQRVERVLVAEGVRALPDAIARDYTGTWFVFGEDAGFTGVFPAPRSPHEHIYLLDAQGHLVLRFPQEPDPKQMIRDISRLLRYSRQG